MLYIVATPIGNLEDMTLRAIRVLKDVDVIASEDTRHTGKLLKHYGIPTKQVSYHDHNALSRSQELVAMMKQGKSVALVSDAGTPCVSDPGYRLVKAAREEGIDVQSVPGACAAVVALSVCGFPTDRFVFEGFLPQKSAARRKCLEGFCGERRTIILYESPYRIAKTLTDISHVLSDPDVCIARELTKKFEEIKFGSASELAEHFLSRKPKGEFVILIKGKEKKDK